MLPVPRRCGISAGLRTRPIIGARIPLGKEPGGGQRQRRDLPLLLLHRLHPPRRLPTTLHPHRRGRARRRAPIRPHRTPSRANRHHPHRARPRAREVIGITIVNAKWLLEPTARSTSPCRARSRWTPPNSQKYSRLP